MVHSDLCPREPSSPLKEGHTGKDPTQSCWGSRSMQRRGRGIERQRRQRLQGPLNIEQSRIRVDVHGQIEVGMAYCSLGRLGSNACCAEKRPKRVSEGVHVAPSPPFVNLGDVSSLKIAIKYSHQPIRYREQRYD